jgi:hypothetical protein
MGDPRLPLREKVLGFPPWEYLVLASFGFLVLVWFGGTLAVALYYIIGIPMGYLVQTVPVIGFQIETLMLVGIEEFFNSELLWYVVQLSVVALGIIAIHAVLGYALDALDWVLRKVRSPAN